MVLLSGYIKNTSGQPIPFATVFLADEFFDEIPGQATSANAAGYFSFWADPTGVYYIGASSVGYKTWVWMIEKFQSGTVLTLPTNEITLPDVVVTSTTQKPFPYWLLAIPAILILSDKKKGNSIGSITGTLKKLPKPVMYVAYAGAAYAAWRIANMFMRHKNPTATPGELEAELPTLPAPTFTDSQYGIWADSIQQQFAGCDYSIALPGQLTGSGKVLNNILKQLNNDADFAKLVIKYGVREYDQCGVWPMSGNFRGNLNQAVTDELASSEISMVNSTLASRNIKYRF
jgi:hypothetical protein